MELKFRQLRADEIDCRVAQIKPNGLTLLLYKDARCDMNILDETVGPMNWQRKHGRDNANCIVSIWDEDKKQWIEKEDTGTESNTEAEKGLASDSFKRACVNWGIGRELYTGPRVRIPCDTVPDGRGYKLKDKWEFFGAKVTKIDYDDNRRINHLVIEKGGKVIFKWPETHSKENQPAKRNTKPAAKRLDIPAKGAAKSATPVKEEAEDATEAMRQTLRNSAQMLGMNAQTVLAQIGWEPGEMMTTEQYHKAIAWVKAQMDKRDQQALAAGA